MARTKQTSRKTTGGKAPRYGGKERLASKGVLRRAAQHKKPTGGVSVGECCGADVSLYRGVVW